MAKPKLVAGQVYTARVVSPRSKRAGQSVVLTVVKGGANPEARVAFGMEDPEVASVKLTGTDHMTGDLNIGIPTGVGNGSLKVAAKLASYRLAA